MLIVSDFGRALGTLMKPKWATKNFMFIGQAMGYYYRFSVVPALIFIAIGTVFLGSVGGLGISSGTIYNFGVGGFLGLVVAVAVTFWVVNPVRMIVFSGLTHLFGRHLFGFFQNSYDNTLSAQVYGITPTIMLSWAPMLGVAAVSLIYVYGGFGAASSHLAPIIIYALAALALFIVSELWSLAIMLIALANQQGVGRLRALLVLAIAGGVGLGAVLGISFAASAVMHIPFYSVFGSVYQFL